MALKKSQQSLADWTKKIGELSLVSLLHKAQRLRVNAIFLKSARESLSSAEYAATSRKKREDKKKGKQFSNF